VFIRVHWWLKNKKPTAVWQWVDENFWNESKPNCRAGQQRVRKQQVQVLIHATKLTPFIWRVKHFSAHKRWQGCHFMRFWPNLIA
jgi:hypothetical protein